MGPEALRGHVPCSGARLPEEEGRRRGDRGGRGARGAGQGHRPDGRPGSQPPGREEDRLPVLLLVAEEVFVFVEAVLVCAEEGPGQEVLLHIAAFEQWKQAQERLRTSTGFRSRSSLRRATPWRRNSRPPATRTRPLRSSHSANPRWPLGR